MATTLSSSRVWEGGGREKTGEGGTHNKQQKPKRKQKKTKKKETQTHKKKKKKTKTETTTNWREQIIQKDFRELRGGGWMSLNRGKEPPGKTQIATRADQLTQLKRRSARRARVGSVEKSRGFQARQKDNASSALKWWEKKVSGLGRLTFQLISQGVFYNLGVYVPLRLDVHPMISERCVRYGTGEGNSVVGVMRLSMVRGKDGRGIHDSLSKQQQKRGPQRP